MPIIHYSIIFSLGLFLFVFLLSKSYARFFRIIFISILVLFILIDGTRWQMGVDWNSYFDYYYSLNMPGVELGFQNIYYFFSYLNIPYSIVVFLVTLFIYVSICLPLYLYSQSLIALFFVIPQICWYVGSQRQMITTGLVSIILYFFLTNRSSKIRELFLTLLGISIHYTTLLPILYFWSSKWKYFFIFFQIIFFTIFFIGIDTFLFLESLYFLTDKLSDRVGGDSEYGSPIMGIVKKCIILGSFFYIFISCRINKSEWVIFKYCTFSIIIYIVGMFYISAFAGRLNIYFDILGVGYLFAISEKYLKERRNLLLLLYLFCTVLIIIVLTRLDSSALTLFYPYSGQFYNFEYQRLLF